MRKEIDASRKNTQVVLLLPTGRDAEVVQSILAREGISSTACDSYDELLQRIGTECGPVIIAQEAFYKVDANPLLAILDSQPQWSELPIIVLQSRGCEKQWMKSLALRPSICFIPRPLRRPAFVTLVRAAMENRLHQFAVRDLQLAQEALKKSEKRYRELFDSITDLVYTQDLEGRFVTVNPALEKLFGYDKANIIGRKASEFMEQKWARLFEREYLPAIKNERFCEGISSYKTKDGKKVYIEYRNRCVEHEAGDSFISGVGRNVTQRIKAQKEKKRLEVKLRQAHKMEAVGTLAGGIAHEFNNMLGVIIGNTELALDDIPEWNPAADCIREIRAASLRAKDVVQKLLSVARKTPESRKPIQIRTIVDESLNLLRKTIPAGIEIRSNLSCTTEMILANPTEINQVLLNLCTNSAHAMVDEKGVLEVALETETLNSRSSARFEDIGPGDYVKLAVSDDGIGISPDILDRIFDPYFTTKDVDEGLGMGLAVAHGIVKKHEGAIKVESEVGKGTTVEVLFPVTKETAQIEKDLSKNLPKGTERILFVDDEPSLVKMSSQILERQGYEVVGKTSGNRALKLFQEESDKFDLVITDMAMPEMTGDRLAEEIFKIRSNIPVVICTGHSDRMNEERAIKSGFAAYTMKPIVKADFVNTVRKVLDEAKG